MDDFSKILELYSYYGPISDKDGHYEMALESWCDRDPLCRRMRRRFPRWKFKAGSKWNWKGTGKIAVILMFPPKE